MKLFSINTGYFMLDAGAIFGAVPKSIWGKLIETNDNNQCALAMRSLIIKTEDKLILVDTGIGNKQDQSFLKHYNLFGGVSLESSLNELGFSLDDVTDVLLTHLHFDHCGGAVYLKDGKEYLTCKNANHWVTKKQWELAINPNDRERNSFLKGNILPLKDLGKLNFIDTENPICFGKDIELRFFEGHTESQTVPIIKYKNKKIIFCADLIPTSLHIPVNYVPSYDSRPLDSITEKKNILEEALSNEYILMFQHDAEIECCSLKRTEKGIRLDKVYKLSDI